MQNSLILGRAFRGALTLIGLMMACAAFMSASFARADAERPKIAVVSTSFVLVQKFRDMAASADLEGVDLRRVHLDTAAPDALRKMLFGADVLVIDAPRSADIAEVEARAGEAMDRNIVPDDQWREFMAVYVEDKYQLGVREWFEDTNPQAMAQITERMIEAIRKGYWTADEETLRKLVEVYSEVAGHHDVVTDNRVFTDFVAEQAAGFGLTLASMAPEVASAALMPSAPSPTVEPPKAQAEPQNTPSETVTGQMLEERVQPPAPPAPPQYFALIPLVLIGFGFLWQGAALALRRDSTQVGDVV